ncbi:MAG: CDP-alcohol phosphatidyltransferase family protein [Spirochaetes bacterium]|nr:MAG: CDP-alcohol phosphatidyltransferase family protein [Spirochaetota bacterium]
MKLKNSLMADILKTIVSFLVFQSFIYGIFAVLFRFRYEFNIWFYGVTILYHFLLFLFLIAMKDNFYLEKNKLMLKRLNIPNILTIFRLSSIPTALFLFLSYDNPLLGVFIIIFLTVIFLTDLLDGTLARKFNEITRIGRYMDSISDYLIIFTTAIVFLLSGLIPLWFFVLLIFRLFLQAGGMGIILLKKGSVDPETSFLGKASVFAVMVLFVLEIFKLIQVPYIGDTSFIMVCEYITGIIISISLVEKFIFLSKRLL